MGNLDSNRPTRDAFNHDVARLVEAGVPRIEALRAIIRDFTDHGLTDALAEEVGFPVLMEKVVTSHLEEAGIPRPDGPILVRGEDGNTVISPAWREAHRRAGAILAQRSPAPRPPARPSFFAPLPPQEPTTGTEGTPPAP